MNNDIVYDGSLGGWKDIKDMTERFKVNSNPSNKIMKHTLFIDIDGTILFHEEDFLDSLNNPNLPALPGVKEQLCNWHCQGYQIVLVTARPKSTEKLTREQLHNAGIVFDELILGVGCGKRVLINDRDPLHPGEDKAAAINLTRNAGMLDINIP